MHCPTCTDSRLTTIERLGVRMAHCPRCGGAWLDAANIARLEGDAGDPTRTYSRQSHDSSGRLVAQGPTRRWSSDSSGRLPAQNGRRSWWRELLD